MAPPEPAARNPELAELQEHARSLAASLAGPLRRVRIAAGDASIEVEWQQAGRAPKVTPSATAAPSVPAEASPAEPSADEADAGLLVTSPMVGTFYRAQEPGASPFVEVGEAVAPGQTVAIIEAMKLFNPITADHAGIVAAVLADNGQAVEFGQPLLRLVPALPDGEARE
ncbi:MAG TPA: acetyl-CoA carboxylase biotin carboxyl carrier protein [Trebonia sp.]|jgi:acetyl-CoA carboxylase biotin carboxyl carrier protein|nr:acetyl-CoA carboxylase biotin carboxyl carrier protein [Trebonia sp.]